LLFKIESSEIALVLLEWRAIVDYAVDNGQKEWQFFYFVDFAVGIDKIVDNAVDVEGEPPKVNMEWILHRNRQFPLQYPRFLLLYPP